MSDRDRPLSDDELNSLILTAKSVRDIASSRLEFPPGQIRVALVQLRAIRVERGWYQEANRDFREANDALKRANELGPLAERIARGRAKYANGCTVLSLLDEAGEVAHAVNKYESADRIREELLDVAAVAMRLYFGEIDRGLEIDGLVQRRTAQPSGVAPEKKQ